MSSRLAPHPGQTDSGCRTDEVIHYFCCDESTAWCGADISESRNCPSGCPCTPCVVCEDAEWTWPACDRCGA